MTQGTANIMRGAPVEMVTDGPCLAGTLDQLEAGTAAKPMPRAALTKIRTDALDLLGKVLKAYTTNVAGGEVGVAGAARTSAEPPVDGRCPTGLLYGRVQSGKTVAMIAFCAAAIDNGFRVVVVLTSDFVKLVEQTADRFTALDGPLIKNALQADNWPADAEHVRKHVAKHGVVFICTKNSQRLTALVEFLQKIGAADYPALVLDDEADQATPDTTIQARSSGRRNPPARPSTIHRITVQDEEGQSVRQTLRHHVFVQVTATPYALYLQNVNSDLRPSFTHLLEPGEGYTGGEAFFDAAHVESGTPPLVIVDDDESSKISATNTTVPPLGLQRALAFFLVAAGAQNVLDPTSRYIGQNFLCHTSMKTKEHDRAADLIRGYLNRMSDELENGGGGTETMMRLSWGYDELRKTLASPPPLDQVLERLVKRLPRRDVPVVNSATSRVDFSRQLNLIVGGNILGRGLTIDNLLVTYYIRRAKISQMDTVLQHARMFGYRASLMPYTRVFLPQDLAARFHFIHVAEQSLRQQIGKNGGVKVMVETMSALRATRLNVLDTRNLAAYEPGAHIYPGGPGLDRRDLAQSKHIESEVCRILGGALLANDFICVDMPEIIALLKKLPFNKDLANMWEPELLCQMLERMSSRDNRKGFIYHRTMSRTKTTFPTGALSGSELENARRQPGPVLCAFRDDGKGLPQKTRGCEFWYPTLVLPSDMATHVFNTTS